jgi:hypothetical protein
MALSFPLDLSALSDKLRVVSVTWDVQRFDEHTGTGSGHDIQAELAKPKWTAEIALGDYYEADLKQLAAIVRKLQGSQNAFYLCDPQSLYPQYDPTGAILGASSVQIHTVGTDGQSLRLKGLPSAYKLTLGDKGQVNFGSSPARTYFFEVSESVTAVGGVTPSFEVFPHVPTGLAANQSVVLTKPACKMIMLPGSFRPGATGEGHFTRDVGFKAIERR